MRGPDGRRFTITDAMSLVAGAALGMAGVRGVFDASWLRPQTGDYVGWVLHGPSTCVVAALAVTLIPLTLRRPRPRRRRLVIRPGFVACVATVVALVLGCGCILFFEGVHTRSPGESYTQSATFFGPGRPGPRRISCWAPGSACGWPGDGLPSRAGSIGRGGRSARSRIAGVAWRLAGPIVQHFAPML